tara:strand:- start:28 stop:630 length:603 start_codon:yes stop_codon:yes gene_type:complete
MEELKRCFIYKLDGVNYIGSTWDIIARRDRYMSSMNNKFSPRYHLPVHKYMRDNKITPNLIILRELFLTKKGRFLVEQIYMDAFDSINNGLNVVRAYATTEQKKQQKRDWEIRNKDKTKERQQKNKAVYNKNRRNKYNNDTTYRNKTQERNKINWNKNKKKYSISRSVKIPCSCCGSMVSKRNMSTHKKSKKCKTLSALK